MTSNSTINTIIIVICSAGLLKILVCYIIEKIRNRRIIKELDKYTIHGPTEEEYNEIYDQRPDDDAEPKWEVDGNTLKFSGWIKRRPEIE